jgi:hypothetical protein
MAHPKYPRAVVLLLQVGARWGDSGMAGAHDSDKADTRARPKFLAAAVASRLLAAEEQSDDSGKAAIHATDMVDTTDHPRFPAEAVAVESVD